MTTTVTTTVTATVTATTVAERALAPFGAGMRDALRFTDGDPRVPRRAVTAARRLYADYRRNAYGYSGAAKLLTAPDAQPKTGKNPTPTYTLMLTPARAIGRARINLCPAASKGCTLACLATSGHGAFTATQRARACRTDFLIDHPYAAGLLIGAEILAALAKHGRIGVRLNCLSDIRWERLPGMDGAMRDYSTRGATFYDYTAWRPAQRRPSAHYSLTYSAKETHSVATIRAIVESGANVAVPFWSDDYDQVLATGEWHGMPVVDGDATDWRPGDRPGSVVALSVKGNAGARDASGFVRTA